MSLPSRGAWIEIVEHGFVIGVCVASLPSRGAWIEIFAIIRRIYCMPSRSPHGERGLKSVDTSKVVRLQTRRSPHGERGLKCSLVS